MLQQFYTYMTEIQFVYIPYYQTLNVSYILQYVLQKIIILIPFCMIWTCQRVQESFGLFVWMCSTCMLQPNVVARTAYLLLTRCLYVTDTF